MNYFYVLIFLLSLSPSLLHAKKRIEGSVIAIIDGDTLHMRHKDNKTHKIRLAKIDAPEKPQAFGMKAKQNLSILCFGKYARAEIESIDRYGRNIAVIFCNKHNANLEQVKQGFAWVYKKYTKDPEFLKAEKLARKEKRGLWIDKNPIEPWNFRKKLKNSSQNNPLGCYPKKTCKQIGSCEEAYKYFHRCKNRALDKDHDNIPCENLCH